MVDQRRRRPPRLGLKWIAARKCILDSPRALVETPGTRVGFGGFTACMYVMCKSERDLGLKRELIYWSFAAREVLGVTKWLQVS
ncbi:hypothetical protein L2E82_22882 [Cichorium intybus]|uniref:Uncharacterized protein n=1 Tax=Cichorium intybus TaxID=13427 RepID=A0ACB9DZA1_CICIN|nr:hypothetical protein L2E82_22882 [Cichorium intybus]